MVALVSLVALLVVFHAAGGWYFASVLNDRALSAHRRLERLVPERRIEVIAVTPGSVTLRAGDDRRLALDGVFGLEWDGGWGTIGAILEHDGDEVTRQFERREGTGPEPATMVSVDTRAYQGDPAATGVAFEDVTYAGELGEYPAWFVPGEGTTWFVFVHGNGMTRRDALRIVPAIASAGLPILIPTYRNDEGAPRSPDGRLAYGKDEWRDLEAAIQYALDHGADSVVLEGMSMGGAVVAAFLLESDLAGHVRGVVFDAPALDFERSVEFQAAREELPLVRLPLPPTLIDTAEWLAGVRFGVDWAYTDYLARAAQFSTPMLLIHGAEDDDVPLGISEDLQRARPDLVRELYIAEGAGHTEAWNVAPKEYERRIVAFLASLGAE